MTTGVLKVDPDIVRTVGTSFGTAGDSVAKSRSDDALGDAARAVPQLRTAGACWRAQSAVAAQVAEIASGARTYGADLRSAAAEYEKSDRTSGSTIGDIQFPS